MNIESIYGMRYIESHHALTTTTKPNRIPKSKKKRIRNKWLKKYGTFEISKPGIFMAGNTFHIHPSLKVKIDNALKTASNKFSDSVDRDLLSVNHTCLDTDSSSTENNTLTVSKLKSAMDQIRSICPKNERNQFMFDPYKPFLPTFK